MRGVAKRLNERYDNGVLVRQSGDLVTFAPPESMTPNLSYFIVLNGSERKIVDLRPIPAAGTPLAWKAFVEL